VIGAGIELTRTDIDRVEAARPVRVHHRSGALWTLNTPAVERLAPALTGAERASGQLWRADARLHRALGPGPGPDPARRVQAGAAADLCLLTGTLREALRTEVAPVRATFVGGRAVHPADPAAR
jgi:hypothetical protein